VEKKFICFNILNLFITNQRETVSQKDSKHFCGHKTIPSKTEAIFRFTLL